MLQAIIRQDGKYEDLRLSDKLHEGFTEVYREDGLIYLTNGTVVEEYVPETTIDEKIANIDKQLYDNDIKRIRAIAENDSLYLSIYNNIAVSLRAERKALTDGGE